MVAGLHNGVNIAIDNNFFVGEGINTNELISVIFDI